MARALGVGRRRPPDRAGAARSRRARAHLDGAARDAAHRWRNTGLLDLARAQETRENAVLALQTQRDLANLYAVAEPTANNAQKEINAAYEAVVNRKTALYDTHPSVKDRIALLEKLPKRPAETGQDRDVQDLLPIYDALAQEMTHTVEQRVMTAELRKLKREA